MAVALILLAPVGLGFADSSYFGDGDVADIHPPIHLPAVGMTFEESLRFIADEAPPLVVGPSRDGASAADAALALAARHDVGLAPQGQGELRTSLESLRPEVGAALATVFTTFLAFEDATRDAFAPLLAGGPAAFEAGLPPMPGMLTARADFLRAVAHLHEAAPAPVPGGPFLDLCPAFALDVGGLDSIYPNDCFLSIDLGGNDAYQNNAGGSGIPILQGGRILGGGCFFTAIRLFEPLHPLDYNIPAGAAAAVDFGKGRDTYGTSGASRSCGVNGGGYFGAGALLDDGGDDRYGFLGALALDHEIGGRSGVNGGATLGFGLLVDGGGNDAYAAGSLGTNGGAGGLGVTDGFLVRVGGGDGLLWDAGGDDLYVAWASGTNGGGHDYGHGRLVDLGGNDFYYGRSEGTNGGGWGAGSGSLVDLRGDDTYKALLNAVNGGGDGLFGPGVGFLLDGSGHDTYQDQDGGSGIDRSVIPKWAFGVGAQIDSDDLTP